MPKVELSLNQGGILVTPKLVDKTFELNSKIRKKRDLTNTNINITNTDSHRRNRVIKKLVRVQLVPNNNPDNNILENNTEQIVETTTKRRRRRLKIKKKKRKLQAVENTKNISLFDEDHLQQATRPRKRIIVTRKRLIHTKQFTDFINSDTPIPMASTRINSYQNSVDHTQYNTITHDYEDTSRENEISDEFDDFDENSYDQSNLEEDISESNDLEDETTHEFVTLKESDFFLNNFDDNEETFFERPDIEENITESNIIDQTTESLITLNESDFFLNNLDRDYPNTTVRYEEDTTYIDVTTEIIQNVTTQVPTNLTNVTTENIIEVTTEVIKEDDDTSAKPIFQDIPEYEPYFPELTESLDAPIILLKTTVLSSIEQLTKTVVQSRLRTYTFVVTRVAGNEQIVTSTTEVKPHTKTTVITEPVTRLTTLTLLDIDATKSLTNPKSSITPALDKPHSEDNPFRNYDEARNLATRVMSNGVEVIVAGNKTIPGDKDFKRLLTAGAHKPVTLKASTLTDHMVMLVPQESSNIEIMSSSLYPNQFITKTCLTTFTYLTTFLEGSTTTVSSHEQVVSNIATEERNTGKILPTPAVGVVLTQHPNLSVGVFHTTYTYLNTVLDGDQPLVVSSKHTVTNTVTAPDDYLSLLKSSGTLSPVKDTNTYYSTIGLEKTLYEGNKTSVTSTKEVVTQVVITESIPPRATSVMTSYIALDVNDNPDASYITTDIVKTYFVTYTYYNTITKNNQQVVNTNISVSSDVVTEKLYIIPKTSMKMDIQSKEQKLDNNFQIFTTKSYLTTFTYFTTLLQDENKETPTVVNSRTSVIENLVSETVDLSLLDKSNLNQIRNAIGKGAKSIVKTITLYNGETFEITAIANEVKKSITPTKVLPIEKTQMPETLIKDEKLPIESSVPNVITGSTIVFVDDDPFAQLTATPILNKKSTEIKNNVNSITDKKTKVSKTKRSTKSKTKTQTSSINPSKAKKPNAETLKANEKIKDKKNTLVEKTPTPATDLLGLGSINIQAIAPVLNAMAGLISTNLKANRRSDVNVNVNSSSNKPIQEIDQPEDIQSRSPIYIPVRGLDDDFEIAESQNIASFDWVDPPPNKPMSESSLINNGIPISPGDIITTNSDVIVGKPGRVGPRIPSIPLHQVTQENEIPVGMKPPPLPNDWRQKNYEYKRIPVVNNFDKPEFIPNDKPEYVQNNKPQFIHNHVPNSGFKINEINNAPIYAKNQKNYIPNRIHQHHPMNQNYFNLDENTQAAFTHNHPVYAHNYNHNQEDRILIADKPLINNIKSSIIHNEPLILPEIIERSTGQPLLVNIQPSQVAFVNIPYNRTTALIYGGSTEPHRNGQYFDDPSPYPQPEFSGIEINDGFPRITSVYQPELPNQKQVNGVIKVDNQLINNEPQTSENKKIPIHIQPTKIEFNNNLRPENQINLNVPPVSYGMFQHGTDFTAHVINHDDIEMYEQNVQRRPPSDFSKGHNNVHYHKNFNATNRKPTLMYPGPVYHDQKPLLNKRVPDSFRINHQSNNKPHNFQKYPNNKKNIFRPNGYASAKPNLEISEFMSPPSTPRIYTKRPHYQKQTKRPVPPQILSVTAAQEHQQTPVNFRPSFPIYEVHVPAVPGNNPNRNPYKTIPTQKYPDFTLDSEVGDHKEDDMENEDGEVVQESNARPLRPGEVPPEVIQAISTTQQTIEHIRVSNPVVPDSTRPIYEDIKLVTQPHLQFIVNTNQEEQSFNNKTTLNNHQFNEIINGKITFKNDDKVDNFDRILEQPNYNIADKPNVFGIGTHEIVSINDNLGSTQKPILIFIDEKQEPQNKFFNRNKERPAVTSLPINSFKESNNWESENKFKEFKTRERSTSTPRYKDSNQRKRPSVTSLPINTFKEYNNRETSSTSLPIDSFKYNRDQPVSSQPINSFKEYNSRDRPAVTSLPINKFKEFNNRDRPAVTSVAINKDLELNNAHKFGTQTEKPFSGVPSKTISSNEIIRKDVALPKPSPTKNEHPDPPIDTDKISNLNTGEVPVIYNNGSKIISEMEVMRPPPLITEIPAKLPDSQKPNVYTVIPVNVEDSLSTLPNLSEEMVPPPKTEEKVIGMVPPPWRQSNIPPKVTTPRYSMEIDVSTEKSTQRPNTVPRIRTRRPYSRRPGYVSTTTTHVPITTSRRRRPVYPEYNTASSTTEFLIPTTPKDVISPSPSIKPYLEVIIGNPDVEFEKNRSSSTTVKSSSSEVPISTQRVGIESDKKIELSSSTEILVPGIHHAGNEIKVIPDITKPLPNTIKTIYNETKSKIQIPTRYITHTKTATVTITKTTVIKSLGMTPSTLTILVTKTEKTTIVDTVTEVHTLVKPTSIVETITTTIKQASSLYPNDFYGTQYPPVQIKPSIGTPFYNYNDTFVDSSEDNENLDDFIIHETDPPITDTKENTNKKDPLEDNDTILVIMTDKNTKNVIKVPNYETQERDEMISTNKDNNILLGGVLIANHPEEKEVLDRCEPECKASRNELCQKIDGLLKCSCRPGFARIFPDRPCLPTYTYDLELTLDRIGKDPLHFYDELGNPNSTDHFKFNQATNEALDRMVMQSDLRDIFHGVKVHNFEPGTKGIVSRFYLQLSENMEEKRLEDILKNYLLNNSFSLGGTDIYSSPLMELKVQDFDECTQSHLHDCSENAHCFNLKGTYSCSCKEGFSDLSENMLYPGRICSAELVGCEKCNYHGTCYSRGADEVLCECFQWYTGQYCHINLKVLLIALVTLGTLLFGLLLTCIILTCVKGKPRSVGVAGGINFLPQGNAGRRNTLDRRAMIQDTSSEEDSKSEMSRYVKKPKPASKKTSKVSMQASERGEVNHAISFEDQKDRSLTVMIPRAKYHPAPPTSPLMNYTSFDVRKPSVPSTSNEAKLLSFLDAGPSPNKSEPTRKFSNAQSESIIEEKANSRKTSGALISAGFEVSATVVNNMGTLGTTCGTEADRSENATLIQKISADLLSSTGTRSQFNTLRKSLADEDLESNVHDNASNWLDMLPRVMTVSEARSCDETTIPPPMKCLRADYDSKHSSHHHNDEANTMAERDLGSTFLLPHTHLYKPDRGSDISGFESL